MLSNIKKDEASVVVTITNVEATGHVEAIRSTEETLMLCRDILALRQLQRGYIVAFLAIQTDVSPIKLYSKVRRSYASLRKVTNLPFGETESDIFDRIMEKAKKHPLLQVYLSLYADTLPYSDTLITEIGLEGRILKTWSFLETMATFESPGLAPPPISPPHLAFLPYSCPLSASSYPIHASFLPDSALFLHFFPL